MHVNGYVMWLVVLRLVHLNIFTIPDTPCSKTKGSKDNQSYCSGVYHRRPQHQPQLTNEMELSKILGAKSQTTA